MTVAVVFPLTATKDFDVEFCPAVVTTLVIVPTVAGSKTLRLFPDESVHTPVVVL